MEVLDQAKIEDEVILVIQEICEELMINAVIDKDFCPGAVIKSHVLLDSISIISDSLKIEIPYECYIFADKYNRPLTITETAQKIIKVSKNGK